MNPCKEQEEAQKEQNSKRGDDLADMDGADKRGGKNKRSDQTG